MEDSIIEFVSKLKRIIDFSIIFLKEHFLLIELESNPALG